MNRHRRSRITLLFAGAALALLGYGLWRQREDARVLARDHPPQGDFVDLADGSRLHFVRRGTGSGPSVVLVHGADGTCCGFEPLLDRLAEKHELIAFDRPGHGWSTIADRGRATVAGNAEALHEAIAKLGVRRPVVIGHSYGAAVALAWAEAYPEELSGLLLVSPAAYPDWDRSTAGAARIVGTPVGRLLTVMLMPLLGGPVLDRLLRHVGFRDDPVPEPFRRNAHAFYLRPSQFAVVAREYENIVADVDALISGYERITLPTIVIGGGRDPLTRVQRQARPLAEALPNATLQLIPGAAHELLWHNANAAAEAVDELVARASAPAQPCTGAAAPRGR